MDLNQHRLHLYEWIRRKVVGIGSRFDLEDTNTSIAGMYPSERYQCGLLFPVVDESRETTLDATDDESIEMDGTDEEEARRYVRYVPPTLVGFSFYVEGVNVQLEIRAWGVRYEAKGRGTKEARTWERHPLGQADEHVIHVSAPHQDTLSHRDQRDVFNYHSEEGMKFRGLIQTLWRKFNTGWIVTVNLCNIQRCMQSDDPNYANVILERREESTLFEVELECLIVAGRVGDYPKTDSSLLSDEDQELELQFAHRLTFAIGHGTAVDWKSSSGHGAIDTIAIDFLPKIEVPQVTADTGNNAEQALDLEHLGKIEANSTVVLENLSGFVDSYANWLVQQELEGKDIVGHESAIARILGRANATVMRMRRGIALLSTDKVARSAFSIANRAMQLQMQQSWKVAGQRSRIARWRPFQLGFILTALCSSIDEDACDRDLVDLIWFPTGGGKTEAYLALSAFVVAWRRIRFKKSGSGTSILMRYTLRLLTAQQFERANRLIFSLELLRRTEPTLGLGNEPITIGIWVGGNSSPNSFHEAGLAVADGAARQTTPKKLLVTHCPWCGSSFQAPRNYKSTTNSFNFVCHSEDCAFSAEQGCETLPTNVVDEALFENPPTLLIGTIDKFARLAWDQRTTAFFGLDGNRPPELIIQDELHLIAGPLGSVAGVYEAAIDTVIQCRGVRPKYVASTATIRNAADQVRKLYARETAIFPPSGLSVDDAYFAKTVPTKERPGRLYVGYLAPGRRDVDSIAPLIGAILAAPSALFNDQSDREALLDAWWTIVSYHGSLKGVGNAYNSIDKDVRKYIEAYLQGENSASDERADEHESIARLDSTRRRVQQLSSVVDIETNHHTFARLNKHWSDEDHLDVLVSTNMISVGVDVSRLATMVVNGQPQTTAEYIQASSRVGRGDVPGIVFTNYARSQARSLSHYEGFRPYHESFYRYVEPTSVTPYSYPCRKRSLHAALVITMRHGAGLLTEESVKDFDPTDANISSIVSKLEARCSQADPDRAEATKAHLNALQQEWLSFIDANSSVMSIRYSDSSKNLNSERLLYSFDSQVTGVWPTLQSMRNVEHTALVNLE